MGIVVNNIWDLKWNKNYEKLLSYYQKNGRLPLIADKENGGVFLSYQRRLFKEGKLSNEKLELLNCIPAWSKENDQIIYASWDSLLSKVSSYYNKIGAFPSFYDNKNGGIWLKTQRKEFKEGKLSSEKLVLLDSLLPNWNADIDDDLFEMNEFNKHMNKVLDYYSKNNKLPSKKNYENCGVWLSNQRNLYLRGRLPEDKNNLLHTKLPNWTLAKKDFNASWNKCFEKVKAYYLQYKKYPISSDKENGGIWLCNQRRFYRNGTLLVLRKELLDEVFPDWLNPVYFDKQNLDNWTLNFNIVKKYFLEHNVLPGSTDNKNGGDWLMRQRVNYKKGNLKEERLNLMNATFGSWHYGQKGKIYNNEWFENFEIIKAYYLKNGTFPVASDKENGGMWLVNQRSFYKKGKLRSDRLEYLNSNLPGWFDGTKNKYTGDSVWFRNVNIVLNYITQNGDLPFWNDYENGGAWLFKQRHLLHVGALKDYRKEELDRALPGWDLPIRRRSADDDKWNYQLEIVKKYFLENNKFPSQSDKDNCGVWLRRQFYLYNRGVLLDYRKEELDRVLPGWNIRKKKVVKIETSKTFEISSSEMKRIRK